MTLQLIYIFLSGIMILTDILKEFCATTSVHGLAFVVETKYSLVKRQSYISQVV